MPPYVLLGTSIDELNLACRVLFRTRFAAASFGLESDSCMIEVPLLPVSDGSFVSSFFYVATAPYRLVFCSADFEVPPTSKLPAACTFIDVHFEMPGLVAGKGVLASSSSPVSPLFSLDVSSMFSSSAFSMRVSAFVPGLGKCSKTTSLSH